MKTTQPAQYEKTSTTTLVFGGSLVAAALTALLGARYYLETEREQSPVPQQRYAHLLTLADVDQDGSISAIEEMLLLERLNKTLSRYEIAWRSLKEKPSYYDLPRIEGAIREYEK